MRITNRNFDPILPALSSRKYDRRCQEVVQQLYTLLLQLYGFERDAAKLAPIRQAMSDLAVACGRPSFDDLAALYGPQVMEEACSSTQT